MPRLVDRYVIREFVPPFLVGLLLVSFVLLMNQVLLLAELFIDKGVPAAEAFRLLALLLPSILAFALPMSVLAGVLGGLARLSADSEIVALQSAGVGPGRLARPVLLFGTIAWLAASPLALWLAPRANHAWVRAMSDSVLARVRLKVNPLEFNESIPNMVFFVQDVDRNKVWHNVFASMTKDPSRPRLVMARTGSVTLFPGERRAVLELSDGTFYSGSPLEPEKDSVTAFDRLAEEVDIQSLYPAVSNEKGVREKDVGELVRDLRVLAADPSAPSDVRRIRAHRLEIHKKFSLPFACVVLALLGLPLGLKAGRSGRAGGFSLSLAVILLYYVLLTAGEKSVMDGRLSAFIGMWAPNVLLAVAGAALLLRAGRERLFRPRLSRVAGVLSRKPAAPPAPVRGGRTSLFAGFHFPAIRFPNLLDRYLARKFLAVFGLVLAALSAAALLATFIERLGDVLRLHKPLGLLVRATWLKFPELLAYILPVAVLAAGLLGLGLLTRTNETTAIKAAGVSAYRSVLAVLFLAAAVSAAAFLVQERVVPAAHARFEEAWARLLDLPPRTSSYLNRHWLLGRSKSRIYHYDYFESRSSTFGRLSVFDIDLDRWALARRFFAEKAVLEGQALLYSGGWSRVFAAAPEASFIRQESGRLEAGEERGAFAEAWKEPLQMTLGELRRYAAEVRGLGFRAARLRTELGHKTALPCVSLIMAFLAVPFGFSMGKKGTLAGAGLSTALAMAYWGTFALFRGLGGAEVLPPFLAAWGANLLFGLGGVFLVFRLRT